MARAVQVARAVPEVPADLEEDRMGRVDLEEDRVVRVNLEEDRTVPAGLAVVRVVPGAQAGTDDPVMRACELPGLNKS